MLLGVRKDMPTVTSVDEFCNVLLRTGSLKFGTFKLASGLLSPYYVDLRLIPSNPEAFQRTVAMYVSMFEPNLIKRAERLAGVPIAGIAYAAVVALNLSKPLLYVRREQKEHGRERRIEGLLQPGDRVVVLDDVVTTGKSILEAAEAIRGEGGIVADAVVLLDREQGAEGNLKREGVKLHSFTTMRRIAEKLLSLGTIDEKQHDEIVRQIVG
jgi:orotate phosphoribosyltransferase